MSLYELQIKHGNGWKIIDAFEDLDAAYQSAFRIERKKMPEELRIRRIDDVRPGISRARTLYSGGLKARREKAVEWERIHQEAVRRRISARCAHKLAAAEAGERTGVRPRGHTPGSTIYFTFMSLSLSLSGLTALYLVEKMFLP